MTVKDAIYKRKSIRSYLDKQIPIEILEEVLDAGRLAPSGRNGQEWKFIVSNDKTHKSAIVQSCHNQKCSEEAPVTIVLCSLIDTIMPCKQSQGTVNCSIAASFMMLRATELGLGTVLLGHFDADKIKSALDIPSDYTPVAILLLGHPNEQGRDRVRKALSDIIIYK